MGGGGVHISFVGVSCVVLLLCFQQAAGDGFVTTQGTHFFVNGNPLFVNGFNSYWLMTVATDPTQREKVTSVFQEAKAHGLNVARTWAFNDGQYKALQTSPGVYDEQVFQALDYVVAEAKRHHIKLILSLANNYENFGGKPRYVNWARSAGQSLSSEDDFFTNPTVKGYYKNHVKTVLTRVNTITGVAYKDEPTIFAWELMNEPRCQSDPSGNSIQGWLQEMAAHVKSIDGNHLLEAGLEGFYADYKKEANPGFSVGTDFIANNQIKDFDFATVHSYPDIWLKGSDEQTQLSFLGNWLQTHLDDATRVLRKPILFAEFGKSSKDPGFNSWQRDNLFDSVYKHIYASANRGGASAGGMFWQLMAPGMSSYGDGYEVVLSQDISTASLIAAQSHKMNMVTQIYKSEKMRKVYAHRKNKGNTI
uniref:mannan endo-1,4-beta-mannosidase n=1 Tax=Araucaria cunninghamii TaxID=56994 RepID=A0A0D6QZM0_ARACU